MPRFELQNGDVRLLVGSHNFCRVLRLITIQRDLHFGGLVDDVIICQDEALLVDDHTRSEAALRLRPLIRKIEETIEKVLKWLGLFIARPRPHLGAALWIGPFPVIPVPISSPMASVTVTSNAARIFRLRSQAANSRSCVPMFITPRQFSRSLRFAPIKLKKIIPFRSSMHV